jgi:hypothetical protein
MSFIDDILDFAAPVVGLFTGSGIVSSLVRTATAGFVLHQVVNSVTPSNAATANNTASTATTVDPGVTQQIGANTANNIPVVYGRAVLGGKVFDAQISANNSTMWFALVISECTSRFGIDGTLYPRATFENVYWNGQRCVFSLDDKVSVTSLVDDSSGTTQDLTAAGSAVSPLKIYLYNNGSKRSTIVRSMWSPGYNSGDGVTPWATNIMPGWTDAHTADELIFAIVQVTYNKQLSMTGLADVKFDITNSLSQPGDAIYDYMLSTRYGAGINAANISI